MSGAIVRTVITEKDIDKIVSQVQEKNVSEIKMFNGKGADRKPVISSGFKLQEPKSGLVYTVMSIVKIDGKLYLRCQRGDGTVVNIPESDLKSYNRL
jgi:hypothetical protein